MTTLNEKEQDEIDRWIQDIAGSYLNDPEFEDREEAIEYAVEDCIADTLGVYNEEDDNRYPEIAKHVESKLRSL